jgi:diguanylate cyclase (GGDEF)-like protein
MIDIQTLLLAALAADLLLAATTWIAAGGKPSGGLGRWIAALCVRAGAWAMFVAAHGAEIDLAVAAIGLLALATTLQGAALLAFGGRRLPPWVHVAVPIGMAVPFALLSGDLATRVLFAGVVLGALLAVLAGVVVQFRSRLSAATRWAAMGSFGFAAALFLGRGVAAVMSREPADFFLRPDALQSLELLLGFIALLGGSCAFLLMHKERADLAATRMATLDPLTGAFNRHTFYETAERELSMARRSGQPLSLVMIDIDHFRTVNERHGQVVGDGAVKALADVIRAQLRKEDMLVRFGGEEFCVMLPQSTGPGAVVVAGRIREAVALYPLKVEGREIPITVSVGVAARLDEGPESLDDLLDRADQALRLAKQRGRNRVVALSLGRSLAA